MGNVKLPQQASKTCKTNAGSCRLEFTRCSWPTWITDPASMTPDMQLRCDHGIRCSRFVMGEFAGSASLRSNTPFNVLYLHSTLSPAVRLASTEMNCIPSPSNVTRRTPWFGFQRKRTSRPMIQTLRIQRTTRRPKAWNVLQSQPPVRRASAIEVSTLRRGTQHRRVPAKGREGGILKRRGPTREHGVPWAVLTTWFSRRHTFFLTERVIKRPAGSLTRLKPGSSRSLHFARHSLPTNLCDTYTTAGSLIAMAMFCASFAALACRCAALGFREPLRSLRGFAASRETSHSLRLFLVSCLERTDVRCYAMEASPPSTLDARPSTSPSHPLASGVAMAVSFCALCASLRAMKRTKAGKVFDKVFDKISQPRPDIPRRDRRRVSGPGQALNPQRSTLNHFLPPRLVPS